MVLTVFHVMYKQIIVVFQFCELGNLSIHVALRNLRPAGQLIVSELVSMLVVAYSFKFMQCLKDCRRASFLLLCLEDDIILLHF